MELLPVRGSLLLGSVSKASVCALVGSVSEARVCALLGTVSEASVCALLRLVPQNSLSEVSAGALLGPAPRRSILEMCRVLVKTGRYRLLVPSCHLTPLLTTSMKPNLWERKQQ